MSFIVKHTHRIDPGKKYTTNRESCRGIVISDGKILLSHEIIGDLYLIPGGGLEKNEDPEECCEREIEEETGYVVRPVEHYLDLYHYFEYKPERQLNHYYICEVVKKSEQKLTIYEKKVKLTPEWKTTEEAYKLFANYKNVRNEEKRKLYHREYMALKAYFDKKGIAVPEDQVSR